MPTHLNPDTLHAARSYSHVVTAEAARLIFISGQVALDREGNLVGKNDFAAQTVQVFENLKAAFAAAGADFTHVVKFGSYIRNIAEAAVLREIRDRYIDTAHPPASTAIEVSSLFRPDLLVEIDAIAVVQ
ncbi:MAG TPA: RidA family protein [Dehalococcoidia bacterium]|nr:RidA family protein [Dehalococcoidia bacterium]